MENFSSELEKTEGQYPAVELLKAVKNGVSEYILGRFKPESLQKIDGKVLNFGGLNFNYVESVPEEQKAVLEAWFSRFLKSQNIEDQKEARDGIIALLRRYETS